MQRVKIQILFTYSLIAIRNIKTIWWNLVGPGYFRPTNSNMYTFCATLYNFLDDILFLPYYSSFSRCHACTSLLHVKNYAKFQEGFIKKKRMQRLHFFDCMIRILHFFTATSTHSRILFPSNAEWQHYLCFYLKSRRIQNE